MFNKLGPALPFQTYTPTTTAHTGLFNVTEIVHARIRNNRAKAQKRKH